MNGIRPEGIIPEEPSDDEEEHEDEAEEEVGSVQAKEVLGPHDRPASPWKRKKDGQF